MSKYIDALNLIKERVDLLTTETDAPYGLICIEQALVKLDPEYSALKPAKTPCPCCGGIRSCEHDCDFIPF